MQARKKLPTRRDTSDKIICYCFDVTERDIADHFSDKKATYETLVQKTEIATECTACRLDLDLVLARLHQQPSKGPAAPAPGAETGHRGLRRPQDLSDAGFIVNRDGISTILRVANRGLFFDDASWIVPYDYSLRIYTQAGLLAYKTRGHLAVDDDLEVDFSTLAECPEAGWFLVSLYPRGRGLTGTTRPQLIVKGPGWVSAVHTQWLSMSCRFKAALIRTTEGRADGMVSLINGAGRRTRVALSLSTTDRSYDDRADIILPARGARLVELDELFASLPEQANLSLAVESDRPVSKHLILRHADGSWSQNHFPNVK